MEQCNHGGVKAWCPVCKSLPPLKPKKMTNNFPTFWFDSNAYFGVIDSIKCLKMAYTENQKPGYPRRTIEEFFKACKQHYDNESINFGLRVEHSGVKTLYEYLSENGIDLNAL